MGVMKWRTKDFEKGSAKGNGAEPQKLNSFGYLIVYSFAYIFKFRAFLASRSPDKVAVSEIATGMKCLACWRHRSRRLGRRASCAATHEGSICPL